MRRRLPPFLGLFLVALFAAPAGLRAGEKPEDTWYALYVSGAKAGWYHSKTETSGEGDALRILTQEEMHFEMSRMGRTVVLDTSSQTTEKADGRVVSFRARQSMGGAPNVTTGAVGPDGKFHVLQGGRTSVVDYPEGALGPAAMGRRLDRFGIEPGKEIRLETFSKDVPGFRATTTMTVGKPEKKDVLGRVLVLYPVRTVVAELPVPSTVWTTKEGEPALIETRVPGLGVFRMFETDEKVAKEKIEPTELFTTTFVASDRAIPHPRKTVKAVYRLGKKKGSLEKIFEDGHQKILSRKDGEIVLEVDAPSPPPGLVPFTLPVKDPSLSRYLSPNRWVESDDPLVKKFADEAVGDETNAIAAARKIEAYVRKKITKKTLNVGFASAAEVARTLEGDCTEHAVLCCALARAKGLPARVVCGLVYVPPGIEAWHSGKTGIFGYHMWAEALVAKGVWLPMDAAIGTFDATHIALGHSDLAGVNPTYDLTLSMLDVLGQLTIQVVEAK